MEIKGIYHEDFVAQLMKRGFERAANSFSRMMNIKVSGASTKTRVIPSKNEGEYVVQEVGEVYVLTTSLIGQLSGKSYLILSQQECHEIYQTLFPNRKMDEVMLEAILLELDNIISAAVVSELVDALQIEVFGDVPALKRINSDRLKEFLAGDYKKEEPSSIIISSTSFILGDRNKISPQFIWKLSPKIFEMIQEGLKAK
jgi:chemotaxis protein CheY-P-specific phosphatase CheC